MNWNSAIHTYISTHILAAAESWQLKHCNTKVHSPMLLFCWVLGIRCCTNEYNSFRKHSCCLALCNSKHSNWIICAKGIKREPSQAIFWAILLWFPVQNRTGRLCNLPWLFAGCFHQFSGVLMRKPQGPKYDDVSLRYIWFLNNKLKTHFVASQERTKYNEKQK